MIEKDTPYLHVYSPSAHHDDQIIIGNRSALRKLRDHIDLLLVSTPKENSEPSISRDTAFTADGEGFHVHLMLVDDMEIWNEIAVPYTSDYCIDNKPPFPWAWIVKIKEIG